MWEEGTRIFTSPNIKFFKNIQIVSDGSGGAIVIVETEEKRGFLDKVYAQRIDCKGKPMWTKAGVQVYPPP